MSPTESLNAWAAAAPSVGSHPAPMSHGSTVNTPPTEVPSPKEFSLSRRQSPTRSGPRLESGPSISTYWVPIPRMRFGVDQAALFAAQPPSGDSTAAGTTHTVPPRKSETTSTKSASVSKKTSAGRPVESAGIGVFNAAAAGSITCGRSPPARAKPATTASASIDRRGRPGLFS